jgi:hypothetical protein
LVTKFALPLAGVLDVALVLGVLLVALGVLLAPGVLLVPLGVLLVGGVLVCCAMALVSARPLTAATTMNRLSMGTLLLDGKYRMVAGARRLPAAATLELERCSPTATALPIDVLPTRAGAIRDAIDALAPRRIGLRKHFFKFMAR